MTSSGIKYAKVQLERQLGRITYDPDVIHLTALLKVVNDLGFKVAVHDNDKSRQAMNNDSNPNESGSNQEAVVVDVSVTLDVDGMTCESCVKSIESVIGAWAGVKKIIVSLDDHSATVIYDPGKTTPNVIADKISDLGYNASVNHRDHSNAELPGSGLVEEVEEEKITALKNSVKVEEQNECIISVRGMTCDSCIRNIESVIGAMDGIVKVSVSLTLETAYVTYNSSITNPELIAEKIDDMGFITAIANDPGVGMSAIEKNRAVTMQPGVLIVAAVVAGSHSLADTALGVISVKGMHCNSCTRNIEGRLKEVPGVITAKVSLLEDSATVEFQPSAISMEQLRQAIESAGDFNATVLSTKFTGINARCSIHVSYFIIFVNLIIRLNRFLTIVTSLLLYFRKRFTDPGKQSSDRYQWLRSAFAR